MPDENTNPIVGTQTSQNNQVVTDQAWDDFVLDFWDDGVDTNWENSFIETSNLENVNSENEEVSDSVDMNFGDNLFGEWEENWDIQEENVKQEGEDSLENRSTLDVPLDNPFDGESNKIDGKNDMLLSSDKNTEGLTSELENNKDEAKHKNVEEEMVNKQIDWDEWLELDGDNWENNYIVKDDDENREESVVNDHGFVFDVDKKDNIGDVLDENLEIEENKKMVENNNINIGVEDEVNGEVKDEVNDTIKEDENLMFSSNDTVVNKEENQHDNTISNLYLWKDNETSTQINSVNDVDSSLVDSKQTIKQPEIGDLMWNYSENNGSSDATSYESNILAMGEENNSVVNENAVVGETPETFNENVQENGGNKVEMKENTNDIEKDDHIDDVNLTNNMTQTLSLDQLLDTELNSNSQFADNTKAVPINVLSHKSLFGNVKMSWVLVWIWLFLLVWLTVFLAFPSNNLGRNTWVAVDTGVVIEEEYFDHSVAEPVEDPALEMDNDKEWLEEYDLWEIESYTSRTTIQQPDFPDVEWEDGDVLDKSVEDSDLWWAVPYICDWEDCAGGSVWSSQVEQLEIWEVMQVVLDFKSQAEVYYSQWDDMQDKKLIRYALQTISLCDNYQKQIENGEGLDELSFSSFRSKGENLLNKMETYLIWEDYSEMF